MDLDKYKIFCDHMDSLKEISKDTSQEPVQYMTERTDEAVNFDLVKRAYTNELGLSEEVALSCDGLMCLPGWLVLIEFKNGKVKSSEIKTKVRDSLLIYGGITGKTIKETREEIEFILVYNEQKNHGRNQDSSSRLYIAKQVGKKAGIEHIQFDLERFQTLYFRAVHTYTSEEFEKYLVKNGLS